MICGECDFGGAGERREDSPFPVRKILETWHLAALALNRSRSSFISLKLIHFLTLINKTYLFCSGPTHAFCPTLAVFHDSQVLSPLPLRGSQPFPPNVCTQSFLSDNCAAFITKYDASRLPSRIYYVLI